MSNAPCLLKHIVAGSDIARLTTTATRSADGTHFIINGEKKWVTQGQFASHALVGCRTGPPGAKGLSVFIVDLSSSGISRRKMENSGVSSSGTSGPAGHAFRTLDIDRLLGSAFIELDNVLVPAENILGKENKGFEIIMSSQLVTLWYWTWLNIHSVHPRAFMGRHYCHPSWPHRPRRQLQTCSYKTHLRPSSLLEPSHPSQVFEDGWST